MSGGSRKRGFQSSPGQDKYSGVCEAANLVDKNKIILKSSETVNKTKIFFYCKRYIVYSEGAPQFGV